MVTPILWLFIELSPFRHFPSIVHATHGCCLISSSLCRASIACRRCCCRPAETDYNRFHSYSCFSSRLRLVRPRGSLTGQQITRDQLLSTDLVRPVQLKFWVASEWLEFIIDLRLIPEVESYKYLRDEILRAYLKSKATASKNFITIDALDKLVHTHLRIDLTDKDARSRMKNFFLSYKLLLCRHGLTWLTQSNDDIDVCHVLSSIRPELLRDRLESVRDFSHYNLRIDFKGFTTQAIKLSEAFQLLDHYSPKRSTKNQKETSRRQK